MGDAEAQRVTAVNHAVYEAIVPRATGATLNDLEKENPPIQVVWPGSRVPANQKMIKAALEYLTTEEYISKKGTGPSATYHWIETKNRPMGQPKGSTGGQRKRARGGPAPPSTSHSWVPSWTSCRTE
jgi:hypothetical protein